MQRETVKFVIILVQGIGGRGGGDTLVVHDTASLFVPEDRHSVLACDARDGGDQLSAGFKLTSEPSSSASQNPREANPTTCERQQISTRTYSIAKSSANAKSLRRPTISLRFELHAV